MRSEVAKLWSEALESGEYTQGRGALRPKNDEYCCLGVLCDLYRKETGKGEWSAFNPIMGRSFFISAAPIVDRSHAVLPSPVRDWAGLKENEPVFPEKFPLENALQGKSGELTRLNDSGQYSFEDLAHLIRLHADNL